jgi:hypothetical protein
MIMQNYFETLSAALDSEGLSDMWPITGSIPYGATVGFAANGRWVSIYRCDTGRYERPVHYATLMADTGLIQLF